MLQTLLKFSSFHCIRLFFFLFTDFIPKAISLFLEIIYLFVVFAVFWLLLFVFLIESTGQSKQHFRKMLQDSSVLSQVSLITSQHLC